MNDDMSMDEGNKTTAAGATVGANTNIIGNLTQEQQLEIKHTNAITNRYYIYGNSNNSGAFIERIGSGGFGKVYKTQIPIQNSIETVAIKAIEFEEDDCQEKKKPKRRNVMKEADRKFIHHRLLHVLDSFEENQTMYIVTQFYAEGSLERNLVLEERSCLLILEQLLEALEVLHGRDFIHRDIKSHNIFVKSSNPIDIVLGDYGLLRSLQTLKTSGFCGTKYYTAPEITKGADVSFYTKAADIYSSGMTALKLLGVIISKPRTTSTLKSQVLEGLQLYGVSRETAKLILQMIHPIRYFRPTTSEARKQVQEILNSPQLTPIISSPTTRATSYGAILNTILDSFSEVFF